MRKGSLRGAAPLWRVGSPLRDTVDRTCRWPKGCKITVQDTGSIVADPVFANRGGAVQHFQETGLLSGYANGGGVADHAPQFAAGTLLVAGDFIL